jgi:hypothetical protein
MEVVGQLHALAALPPGERASSHWIGGWVGLRAGVEVWRREKSLAAYGNRTPAVQPVAPSLYRLSYPGSHLVTANLK